MGIASLFSTAVFAEGVSPYAGWERQTKGDTTIGYIGVDGVNIGGLEVATQLDFDAQDDNDVNGLTNINLDASYALTNQLSVYTENDLTNSFDRTETMVGVRYNFK